MIYLFHAIQLVLFIAIAYVLAPLVLRTTPPDLSTLWPVAEAVLFGFLIFLLQLVIDQLKIGRIHDEQTKRYEVRKQQIGGLHPRDIHWHD